MSPLLVFNSVYRLEIQSVMLVFSTQLCELLPSRGEGDRVVWRAYTGIIHCLFYQIREPTKLFYHPKQKPRRGGGLRHNKHMPQSTFSGQFLRNADI